MQARSNPNYRHGLEVGEYRRTFKQGLSPLMRAMHPSCMQCGATRHLVTHHLDENQQNDVFANFAVLCSSCHIAFHKSRNVVARTSMTLQWTKITASLLKGS